MHSDTDSIRGRLGDLADADPRFDDQYVRLIDAHEHPVVLVGVVHDHPASVHRARRAVAALDPGVVALETPNAVADVFESYAAADDGDPSENGETPAGGEMTAAAAASDAAVVGVDAPGRGTLAALAATLRDEAPDARTAARALAGLGRLAAHTARGWLAARGVPERALGGTFDRSQSYDCPVEATPREQANHEAARVDRSTTLLRAFKQPPATRVLDAVRERQMAARLGDLAGRAPVVAVLGFSHLDAVEAGVRDAA